MTDYVVWTGEVCVYVYVDTTCECDGHSIILYDVELTVCSFTFCPGVARASCVNVKVGSELSEKHLVNGDFTESQEPQKS